MFARQRATLAATQRTRKFLEVNAGLLTGVDFAAARVAPDEVGASFSALVVGQEVNGAEGEAEHQWRFRRLLRRVVMFTHRLRRTTRATARR